MALALYLLGVLTDGDVRNDWLTHLPEVIRPAVAALGSLLALVLGL